MFHVSTMLPYMPNNPQQVSAGDGRRLTNTPIQNPPVALADCVEKPSPRFTSFFIQPLVLYGLCLVCPGLSVLPNLLLLLSSHSLTVSELGVVEPCTVSLFEEFNKVCARVLQLAMWGLSVCVNTLLCQRKAAKQHRAPMILFLFLILELSFNLKDFRLLNPAVFALCFGSWHI